MMTDENETNVNSFFDMVTERGVADMPGTYHFDNVPANMRGSASLKLTVSNRSIENDDQSNGYKNTATAEDSQSTERSCSVENTDMPHEARRVLVHLMRQGVIIAAQKPKLFESVCRYEAYVRRHLSEVYLQLVLDARSGVVFVASLGGEYGQPQEENSDQDAEEDFSSLISKRTLSLYDTFLLLVLRKHYQDRESAGEQKITIDLERLESYLTPFLPLTDHASLDRKKLIARVKEMTRRKMLSAIRGSEERYEITPVIRYVVNAEFLETMLDEYKRLAREVGAECTNDDAIDNIASENGHSQ